MSATLNYTETLATETCCVCGIAFAMPVDFMARKRRNTGEQFYCPSGHDQHYLGKSHQQMLDEAKQARSVAEAQAREARAKLALEQTKAARLQKRIKAGVCPRCQRTFTCLARHMKSKHPDYAKGAK